MADDKKLPVLDDETLAFAQRVFDLARYGDPGELAALLDQGLPLNLRNGKGDSLLMLAAYNGNGPAVRVLLERGADPDLINDNGQAPLAGVAFKGDLAITRLLLEHGAAVDAGDRTPLMVAAMFDRVEIADLLLAHGADPDRRDPAGRSLGDLAATMGAGKVPELIARWRAQRTGESLH